MEKCDQPQDIAYINFLYSTIVSKVSCQDNSGECMGLYSTRDTKTKVA